MSLSARIGALSQEEQGGTMRAKVLSGGLMSTEDSVSEAKLQRLRQMLRTDPQNQSLRKHLFDTATDLGRFDVVKAEAEQILRSQPQDALAMFNLGNALIASNDHRAALDVLRELQQLMPSETAVAMNVGLCHYCLREFDRARPPLERCYENGIRSAGLLRLLVSTYHHLGSIEEALAIANQNAEPAAADAALAGAYALLYLDANDAARAARWAKTALELDPGSLDGRLTQATLLTARMQSDQARQILKGLIQEAPGLGRAWIGLGTLDLLEQDLPRAKQHLAKGLELMPTHVGSWHVLAWAQLLSGDLDAAEKNFDRALELDRNFAETHGGLASVAALRGQRDKAEHLIEIALRLDPECLSATFARSVLMSNAGESERARKNILDTAASLGGKDPSALSRFLLRATRR